LIKVRSAPGNLHAQARASTEKREPRAIALSQTL
jgi:hypothetical protein